MKRYEYKYFSGWNQSVEDIEKRLNQYAAKGFRLVQFAISTSEKRYVMEREISGSNTIEETPDELI